MDNGYCAMQWAGVYTCECVPGFTLTRMGSMCADLERFPNLGSGSQPQDRLRNLNGGKKKPGSPQFVSRSKKKSGFGPAPDTPYFSGKGVITNQNGE
ncbi:hypothetical protein SARC_16375, partial [Sphaeroforma arctica JP610]